MQETFQWSSSRMALRVHGMFKLQSHFFSMPLSQIDDVNHLAHCESMQSPRLFAKCGHLILCDICCTIVK